MWDKVATNNNNEFNRSRLTFRGIFALLLVFASYNPEGYSYYHWGLTHISTDAPAKVFAGIVLLIGWAIYLRATLHWLGFFGIVLAVAFLMSLVWLLLDRGWIPTDSVRVLSYVGLLMVSVILTTGMRGSFFTRKMWRKRSGQSDVVGADKAGH